MVKQKVFIINVEDIDKYLVQERLFEIGYVWAYGSQKILDLQEAKYFFLYSKKKEITWNTHNSISEPSKHNCLEVQFEYVLQYYAQKYTIYGEEIKTKKEKLCV